MSCGLEKAGMSVPEGILVEEENRCNGEEEVNPGQKEGRINDQGTDSKSLRPILHTGAQYRQLGELNSTVRRVKSAKQLGVAPQPYSKGRHKRKMERTEGHD